MPIHSSQLDEAGCREVVTLDLMTMETKELQAEVLRLRERNAMLLALTRLLFAFVRATGIRLDGERLPDGAAKEVLLTAITRSTRALPLAVALRVLGLSASRYHAWRRAEKTCALEDLSSCPKST